MSDIATHTPSTIISKPGYPQTQFLIIKVQDIQELTQVSYPAANQLMKKFIEQGLLTEVTGQARNRQFRYGSYIDLFS